MPTTSLAAGRLGYSWLLWLYPREFRREFSDEFVRLADELIRERGWQGRRVLALDLVVAVPRTRWEYTMRSTPTPGQLIFALVVLATATLVTTVLFGLSPGGTAIAAAVTVVLLVLAASQRTTLGRAFGAPDEAPRPTPWAVLRRTWWTPVAALHGCLTLLFGVALGFSGEDLLGSVIGAVVGIAAGALVLFGLVILLARPGLGSAMVVIGSLPLGSAFWLVWPPALMVVVWVGVIASAIGRVRREPRTV